MWRYFCTDEGPISKLGKTECCKITIKCVCRDKCEIFSLLSETLIIITSVQLSPPEQSSYINQRVTFQISGFNKHNSLSVLFSPCLLFVHRKVIVCRKFCIGKTDYCLQASHCNNFLIGLIFRSRQYPHQIPSSLHQL